MSYPWLPLEIHVYILRQLEPSLHSNASVKTLVDCSQTNSLLRSAAILPDIWEPHYRVRYSHSEPQHEAMRREKYGSDFRLMYAERYRLDQEALEHLESMMVQPQRRHTLARRVAHDMSFDVWRILELQTQAPIPRCFLYDDLEDDDPNANVPPHAITRIFWAKAMLGTIARRNAIRTWGRLKRGEEDVSFEEALSGLSAFFCVSPHHITSELDIMGSLCRVYLSKGRWPIDTSVRDEVEDAIMRICEFMRNFGFRAADPGRFHNLFNHFPHCVLNTHKVTLPMSLIWLFVSISRRLGLDAAPVDFPRRVLAHVAVTGSERGILVDVYGSDQRAVLSVEEDIPRMLAASGFDPRQVDMHAIPIDPSPTKPMLLRASRNIGSSFHIMTQDEFDEMAQTDYENASYAALCADLILMNNGRALTHLVDPEWPARLDVGPVLMDSIVPLLSSINGSILETRCKQILSEDEVRAPQYRSTAPRGVKYFCGMFFTHITYGYTACIVGWEPTCMASEEWISRMGVDHLSGGRHQAFYRVITLTGSPRYVAEQNIVPMQPTPPYLARSFFLKHQTMGMYFEDADMVEGRRGRMLLSRELSLKYPEDDEMGARWVEMGRIDYTTEVTSEDIN
ncbi:hypothetical protein NEOLEDRAFT_1126455 [Neolentinus lepideus HHB14362 ss-1]|uniref:Hemimethylated DNA-binding domain-containing protein n=1 Tax=Neolentinus lepideus HHB14362 ss-1 TaxID=1314782 RepID=A0A165W8A4_9AGAM|nr:hypothetical protein NEOLEDRAFT_1126455 [Neolentinus lepideus HHB14362 ss-1]